MENSAAPTRRRPERTVLYRTVQAWLETFLLRHGSDPDGSVELRTLPRFVTAELRAFLACGIAAHGFCRVHCTACGKDELVAFSCKRRGFCPSCCGRRMADTAAFLVDDVLPPVPVRQWVLSLPHALRVLCAYDPAVLRAVRALFVRAVSLCLLRKAPAPTAADRGSCSPSSPIRRSCSGSSRTSVCQRNRRRSPGRDRRQRSARGGSGAQQKETGSARQPRAAREQERSVPSQKNRAYLPRDAAWNLSRGTRPTAPDC